MADLAERCRSVALAETGEDGCVYGDMTERVLSHPELHALYDKIHDMRVAQQNECILDRASRRVRKEKGREFMKAVVDIFQEQKAPGLLDKVRGSVAGYCNTHDDYCAITVEDSFEPLEVEGTRMHASGVTCIDWSSRGAGWGFLGDSFDAFVVFFIERLTGEKDMILIECTELFD